jgi:hypothetical protein
MWPFVLVPMIALLIAGVVAWQHATRVDQQMAREMWARQAEPNAALGVALAALVTAVAAAMLLQMMVLPRIAQ